MEQIYELIIKVLSFAIIFGGIVFFHELGHFLLAKYNNVYVEQFMIGFGPALYKFKYKETLYSIRLLPLGGAVMMLGEEDDIDDLVEKTKKSSETKGAETTETDEKSKKKSKKVEITENLLDRTFASKTIPQKLAILFAGPIMNFVLAVVLFAVIFLISGFQTTLVSKISDDSPAFHAGLESGDRILSINNQKVTTWNEILSIIAKNKDKELEFSVNKNDDAKNQKTIKIKPVLDSKSGRYIIGFSSSEKIPSRAVGEAFVKTYDVTIQTLMFIPKLFTSNEARKHLSGPIGIATLIGDKAGEGDIMVLLLLAAMLSVNLGVLNLLPISPLDGGKIFLYSIEGIIRRPINEKLRMFVEYSGLLAILSLFVYAIINDIFKVI